MQCRQLDAKFGGHLLFRGSAAKLCCQCRDRLVDMLSFVAGTARRPVEFAQAVEDRSLDAELRVRLKLNILARVKIPHRVNQAQNTRVHEIFERYVLRQALVNSARDVIDLGNLAHDHLVVVGACPPLNFLVCRFRECHCSLTLSFIAPTLRIAPGWSPEFQSAPAPRSWVKTVPAAAANRNAPEKNTAARDWPALPARPAIHVDLRVRGGLKTVEAQRRRRPGRSWHVRILLRWNCPVSLLLAR